MATSRRPPTERPPLRRPLEGSLTKRPRMHQINSREAGAGRLLSTQQRLSHA